jgi:DNA-binding response OmpR family regulator
MRDKPLILVVDDEPQMVGIVTFALESQGFDVLRAYDGEQALQMVAQTRPDLIVLDVMMPKMDGFEVCQQVRQKTSIPVLLLTARSEDEDVIRGLELGADDYVMKPFNPRAMALRAQAILRRCGWGNEQRVLSVRELALNLDNHQVTVSGQTVALTANEFELLQQLMLNAGRVISWQALLKEVWQVEVWDGGKEMVKTAIYRLRQKIEVEPDHPDYIMTVRGVGYLLHC